MKADKQLVNTLEDNIRNRGAMDKLISDRAKVEISNKEVKDVLVLALFVLQTGKAHRTSSTQTLLNGDTRR
jgi:hypothetical protein